MATYNVKFRVRYAGGTGDEWSEALSPDKYNWYCDGGQGESRDWTGQCMRDYLSAIDDAATNLPFVDRDRLGAVGASFGGFSVYYLTTSMSTSVPVLLPRLSALNAL